MNNTFLKIIHKLEQAGYKAYFVGGCVRDIFLNKKPDDIDIATSAKPDEIENIFDKTIPTGKKFGTITVVMDNKAYEVTTFRTDGKYNDCRRPDEVTFTSDIQEDLSRRDFTINAMAIDKEGNVIDPFGGHNDIALKIIRCVGSPDKRFKEDALRMMRAVRFASTLGFRIETNTVKSIKENAKLINKVSIERIRNEFNKLILSNNPGYGINLMVKTGLMKYIIPEFLPCIGFEQKNPHHNLDVYKHILAVLNSTPQNLILRLSALFHDIAKPKCFTLDKNGVGRFFRHEVESSIMAKNIMQRMKYSNKEIEAVTILVKNHMERVTGIKPVKLLKNVGKELIFDLFKLERADILGTVGDIQKELQKIEQKEIEIKKLIDKDAATSVKDLAIDGYDLMKMGIEPGKEMGRILNSLLEVVLDSPDKNSKELLIQEVKERMVSC